MLKKPGNLLIRHKNINTEVTLPYYLLMLKMNASQPVILPRPALSIKYETKNKKFKAQSRSVNPLEVDKAFCYQLYF